jgi:hypothetical protein
MILGTSERILSGQTGEFGHGLHRILFQQMMKNSVQLVDVSHSPGHALG